jgi:hypothetical protein
VSTELSGCCASGSNFSVAKSFDLKKTAFSLSNLQPAFASLKKPDLSSHFCKRLEQRVSCKFSALCFGTYDANTKARPNAKEDLKMKTTMTKQGAYIGAGAGLVLFGLFGLLPGSLLGGAAGIQIAGLLFGLPLEPGLISRVLVLMGMLLGVLVSGIVIVTATSTIGWLVGAVVGTTVQENTLAAAGRR